MNYPERRRAGSITRSILSKQPRVLLFCPQDADGLTLLNQLQRIGCIVEMHWPPLQEVPNEVDLIFLALQPDEEETDYDWLHRNPPPIISVSSFENPTIIDEALRIGVMGMLTAPIRAAGLLSALIMALSHRWQHEKNTTRITRLESKFANFRIVEEAKTILMRMQKIDENEAYELLRLQAMTQRLQVEDIARDLIHADKLMSKTLSGKTIKTKKKVPTEMQ